MEIEDRKSWRLGKEKLDAHDHENNISFPLNTKDLYMWKRNQPTMPRNGKIYTAIGKKNKKQEVPLGNEIGCKNL